MPMDGGRRRREEDPDALAERVLAGDRRAVARAISLAEDEHPGARRLLELLYPHAGKARTLGITGPPGVGKSSLIAALCGFLRAGDQTIGVITVDPSSHITHGALLGDRIRLVEHFLDSGVYIRSMGTRGHLGGVAEATLLAGVIVDASGRDVLLYETVGVGQSEVEVAALADTVALVLMPGSGDSIQALKAGVMEIPDIIVVNKSDHPAIERTRAELAQVLSLAEPERRPVVIETVATAPSGIDELWAAVEAHQAALAAGGGLATRRTAQLRSELLALASARTARRLSEALDISPELQAIVEALAERRIDPLTAVQRLLDRT
jgi:LAO/AO transport system kinase